MKSIVAIGVLAMAAVLTGCAFTKAVTFQGDDATSNKRDEAKLTLEVYGRSNPDDCVAGPVEPARPAGQRSEFVVLPIVAAVAEIGLNVAQSEIEDYLAAKQKQFSSTYSATTTVPYYYTKLRPAYFAPTDQTPPAYQGHTFNCLRITRTIKEGTKPDYPAFTWIGSLRPDDSGTALKIRTEEVILARAAALTDKASRKVDLTVEIKIDAISIGDKSVISSLSVADKTLSYQGLTTPGDATLMPVTERPAVTSSWFPAIPRSTQEEAICDQLKNGCSGVSAVTISAKVTEVGSGGEAFGMLGKQIDDNKKTLDDAVSSALNPKAGGGSSKN